jgi:hypothetical protein
MIDTDRENQIIATVGYIHQRMGFREPPFSFKHFFDAFEGYRVAAANLPSGYDGEFLKRGAEKIIRYRAESHDFTTRFTIAHEIAHSFLHHQADYCCKMSKSFRIYSPPRVTAKEAEANFFALELLVPLPVLNRLAPDLEGLTESGFLELGSQLGPVFGINSLTMKARLKDLAIYRRWDEGEWL